MQHDVEFIFKKQKYSELALARREQYDLDFAERFEADLKNYMVVLPLKPEIAKFSWIVSQISHEYLHLIVTELENETAGLKLDELGYNLTSGCINDPKTKKDVE